MHGHTPTVSGQMRKATTFNTSSKTLWTITLDNYVQALCSMYQMDNLTKFINSMDIHQRSQVVCQIEHTLMFYGWAYTDDLGSNAPCDNLFLLLAMNSRQILFAYNLNLKSHVSSVQLNKDHTNELTNIATDTHRRSLVACQLRALLMFSVTPLAYTDDLRSYALW